MLLPGCPSSTSSDGGSAGGTAGGSGAKGSVPDDAWAAQCSKELESARELLAKKEPRLGAGVITRLGGTAEEWVPGTDGPGIRYSACIGRDWCFDAIVAPLELIGLPPEDVPFTWERLPEVTVCLSSGRRTTRRMGWLRATFDSRCTNKPSPSELLVFEEAMRPAVERCLGM
ncbi:MAG: hypothetical protein Q8S33_23715 [Myxococcales bacterium]|nr:hypothetical protein [Myxococcales bacterium]MDP3503363.1 hypothetical protein [Myxococcales bacterium]